MISVIQGRKLAVGSERLGRAGCWPPTKRRLARAGAATRRRGARTVETPCFSCPLPFSVQRRAREEPGGGLPPPCHPPSIPPSQHFVPSLLSGFIPPPAARPSSPRWAWSRCRAPPPPSPLLTRASLPEIPHLFASESAETIGRRERGGGAGTGARGGGGGPGARVAAMTRPSWSMPPQRHCRSRRRIGPWHGASWGLWACGRSAVSCTAPRERRVRAPTGRPAVRLRACVRGRASA